MATVPSSRSPPSSLRSAVPAPTRASPPSLCLQVRQYMARRRPRFKWRQSLTCRVPFACVRCAVLLAGGYHSVALDAEGYAWSWGRGEWGRLGHGDSSDCYEPTKIEGGGETHSVALPKLTAAFGADAHSGCLTVSGEVYTWGRNENWQLGYEVRVCSVSARRSSSSLPPKPC